MTPDEAARLLAVAGTFDARLRPPTPEDAQARALAWSAALVTAMPAAWAQSAIVQHYADSTDAVMPAHLNARWKAHRRQEAERDASRRALDMPPGVPMPDEVKARIKSLLASTAVE